MNAHQRRVYRRKHGINRRNFIFSSCGNDSVALLKFCIDHFPNDENIMVYSNTGWAAPFWPERVEKVKEYAEKNNVKFIETKSEGMEKLVRRKKGWPMPASKFQFCTMELKVKPAIKYMAENDKNTKPHFRSRCLTGIRRDESTNRKNTPELMTNSEKHGGRTLFCPLVKFDSKKRDALIKKTGLEILSHQSRECFPCINSNRSDFRMLSEYRETIEKISIIEKEMGFTRKNKPRVMFRPYRHMGAIGIKNVVQWGLSERGKYNKNTPCDSGFCGL